jgi:hypothetical protein
LAAADSVHADHIWRLTDTRINSSEAATVVAAICEHLLARSVEWVVPFTARDLSISLDGDVLIEPRPSLPLEPVVEVVTRLLGELVELVDDPVPALEALAGGVSQGSLPPFSDLAELADWMEQAFALRDSRAVLRPIAARMDSCVAADDVVIVDVPGDIDLTDFQEEAPDFPLQASGFDVKEAAPTRARRIRRVATTMSCAAVVLIAVGLVEHTREKTGLAPRARPDRVERTGEASTVAAEPASPALPAAGVAPSENAFTTKPAAPTTPEGMNATARDQLIGPARRSLPVETPGITASVFSPSFDSTGSVMFFHVGRSPRAHLVEGRLNSQEQLIEVRTFADDGSRNYHARLSPDGSTVAFDSDRDGERGVYIARRDGSSPRKVSGSGFAAAPTWSPDGTHLAFVRGELSRPRVWNLWLLDVASGELERVTSYARGQLWSASWFPDGTRVCYSHEESLYVIDLETHARQRFDAPVRGRMVRTPAVSPEGRRIVFQVHGDGVWMLELDTGSMRRILDDATAEEFTWDSRGARVAYHSRRDGQWRIWITAPPLPSDPTP